MKYHTQVRDPVHGFIGLTGKELDILNTPLLQRLRRIRQLAMADLLYPGALHTRFDHTLGVCHVTGLLCDALEVGHDDRTLVRQAALLHDVGHGPFSHVSESVLSYLAEDVELPEGVKRDKIHELITAEAVLNDPDLAIHVARADRVRIVDLLKAGYGEQVLREIISGPLDADKQDYLLRDSYFCGVKYGLFDIHQLHRSLIASPAANGRELRVDPDGIHSLEQFILAKYYLTTQVYRHRVRLVTDQMLIRALVVGAEKDGIEQLARAFRFKQGWDFARGYLEWHDSKLLEAFTTDGLVGTKCGQLLKRLRDRRLLKCVFEASINSFDSPAAREFLSSLKPIRDRATFTDIEMRIAAAMSEMGWQTDPDTVIAHIYTIKSVREQSRNEERSIVVHGEPPRTFEDVSTLFASVDEKMNEQYVTVFAPMDIEDPVQRRKNIDQMRQSIHQILTDVVSGEENGHA
jgi:uncharacterized protein